MVEVLGKWGTRRGWVVSLGELLWVVDCNGLIVGNGVVLSCHIPF